jgi:hypothetical protein
MKQSFLKKKPSQKKYGPTLRTYNTSLENKTILGANKGEVIVGSYAFNQQVKYPFPYKKTPHTDIDIKHRQPKRAATRIERALDKKAGFDNYHTTTLQHDTGTTHRIHSRSRGNKVVADVSKLNKKIPTVTIQGEKYETLAHRKKEIQKMLRDPKAKYRRNKDLTMMGYIKRYEKVKL